MNTEMTWKRYKQDLIEKYGQSSDDIPEDVIDGIDWALVFDGYQDENTGPEEIPSMKPVLVMVNPVPGMEYLTLDKADYVVENLRSTTGFYSLVIGRFGAMPNIQLYMGQISILKPIFFFYVCWRDVENVFYSKFTWRR